MIFDDDDAFKRVSKIFGVRLGWVYLLLRASALYMRRIDGFLQIFTCFCPLTFGASSSQSAIASQQFPSRQGLPGLTSAKKAHLKKVHLSAQKGA